MGLIQQIHADALVPARMPNIMASVGKLFRAESSFLFTCHSPSEPDDTLIGQNVGQDEVAQFASYWSQFDVWAEAARRRGLMKKDVVVTGSQLVDERQLQRSRFFHEFGRRAGMGKMLGSVLFDGSPVDDVPFTNLCWYRDAAHEDFNETDRRRLRRLLPHLQAAVHTQRRVRQLDLHGRIADAASATRSAAWVLLDNQATMLESGGGGTLMAHHGAALIRTCNGRVVELGCHSFPAFPDLFAYVRATGCSASFVVRARHAPVLLKGMLLPVPAESPTLAGSFHQPRYLLTVDLPRVDRAQVLNQVASLFGLTTAERDVLGLLLDGLSAGQIAAQRGARLSTVRSQLRAILEKTGCTRQIDLVQLAQGVLN